MLKELDIHAFGKRMKISNAITDLRRPPSVNSSSAASVGFPPYNQTPGQAPYGSSRGTASTPHSVLYSPESAPHTGDVLGTPLMDRFSSYGNGYGGRSSLDIEKGLLPIEASDGSGKIVGLGITKTVLAPASPRSMANGTNVRTFAYCLYTSLTQPL